jgi:hypothetical protein
MKNILPEYIIEKANYVERRLIIYLLGKRGKKPGVLLRNPGDDQDNRLKALSSLINKNVVKIVNFDRKNIYFKFVDNFDYKKVSVSFGCYI